MSLKLSSCGIPFGMATVSLWIFTASAWGASINFTGPEQSLHINATNSGTTTAALTGAIVYPAIMVPPVQSGANWGSTTATATPASPPSESTEVIVVGATPTAISNLSLDLLHGSSKQPLSVPRTTTTLAFRLDTDEPPNGIYDFPLSVPVDFSVNFSALSFSQSDPGLIHPDGAFSLSGLASGSYGYQIKLSKSTAISVTDQSFSQSQALSGIATVTPLGNGLGKLQLDGTLTVPVVVNPPHDFNVDSGAAALMGTLAIAATYFLEMDYHLEALIPVPEPGSAALLVCGIAGLAMLVRSGCD